MQIIHATAFKHACLSASSIPATASHPAGSLSASSIPATASHPAGIFAPSIPATASTPAGLSALLYL